MSPSHDDSIPYSADRSFYGKLRRRLARMTLRKPARLEAQRRPLLTISFDDAPQSAARDGAAILNSHGVHGTFFISAGFMDANDATPGHLGAYATADDVVALAAAGHEIACHTYSHLDCGKASGAEITHNIARNQDALKRLGIAGPRTFAYPYGDVSPQAKHVLHDRYLASRALHKGLITSGTDLNQAPAVGIEGPDGEQVAGQWMLRAITEPDSWLVLYTHDVRPEPSEWGCTPRTLDRLIDKAVKMGFEIVTFEEGARRALGLHQTLGRARAA